MSDERRRQIKAMRRRRVRYMKIIIVLILVVGVGTGYRVIAEKKEQKEAQRIVREKKLKIEAERKAAEAKAAKEKAAAEEAAKKEAAEWAALSEDEKKAQSESLTGQEDPNAKVVYLTFDDGPSDKTPAVLDILKKYNVKATFFVTGYHPELRDLIKKAYEDGHTIGLHTFSHDYASLYSSPEAYFQDLEAVGQVVKEQIGYVPSIIRFPGGASNTVSKHHCPGIMSQLVNMVHERGYEYYDWNCSSGDGGTVDAEGFFQRSISCDGYQQVMLLCHDSAAKQSTVDALPRVIEFYQSRGYEFRGIKRGDFVAQHGVNN